MSKQNVLWVLLDLVFLLVFNIVFYVFGGDGYRLSAWLSYAFVHLAYVMLLLTPLLVRRSTSASVFGFALYQITGVYFIIELVVGSVFIALNHDDVKVALVVQVILFGVSLALLLSNMISNESTADSEVQRETEALYIANATSRLKVQLGATGDKQTDRAIERAYDLVRTSPTKSTPEVRQYELRMLDLIEDLERAVAAKDPELARNCAERIVSSASARKEQLRLVQ